MAFPVELARSAAFELTNLLRDYKNNVVQGDTAYLRDADPESYIGKLAVATERRACRKWASEGIGKNAGTDAVMDGLCKLYLEDIGEYPGEPSTSVPFPGGQCDCGAYEYTVVIERPTPSGSTDLGTDFRVRGPVESISIRESTVSGNVIVEVVSRGLERDTNQPYPTCGDLQKRSYALSFQWDSGQGPAFIREIRLDSDPGGDCGDPSPVVDPPTPRPDPGPPSPITIAPNFDVDIDVDFFPDGTLNVKFNIGGEGTGPGDDPVEIPVDPSPETREPGGEPGDPVTGTPGSEEEGEAEDGEILVGILVEVDSFPDNANVLFTPSGPVYKGAYYAYLGVEDRLDLQPEGSVARQAQFYFAPPDSTHWRVSSNAGYTTTITPYYRPINEA